MRFETEMQKDAVATVKLTGPMTHAGAFADLRGPIRKLRDQGMMALGLNCDGVSRASAAGLAGFIDFLLEERGYKVCAYSLPSKIAAKIEKLGLMQALPIVADKAAARQSSVMRSVSLGHTTVVILGNSDPQLISPLTKTIAPGMSDILGRPVLAHTLDRLQQFGARNIIVSHGRQSPSIQTYFRKHRRTAQSLFYCNQGALDDSTGSATALVRMQTNHTAFQDDFLVLDANDLIDIDYEMAIAEHQRGSAALTLITGQDSLTGTSKRVGYVMSPTLIDLIPEEAGLTIESHLIPRIQSAGLTIINHAQTATCHTMSSARYYYEATRAALNLETKFAPPMAKEIRPGVWIDELAKVSRSARIKGPCYVGAGATIDPGAEVTELSAIGAGAVVGKGARIVRSVVLPGTLIAGGQRITDKIVHDDWVLDHSHENQMNAETFAHRIVRFEAASTPMELSA